ncbi:hypothetical protein LCGC14_2353680, partial [marine sediment metagenome]
SGEVKFADYTLPGGQNYREVMLTLPLEKPQKYTRDQLIFDPGMSDYEQRGLFWIVHAKGSDGRAMQTFQIPRKKYPTSEAAIDYIIETKKPEDAHEGQFTGGHFDQPNVLAHFRIDDREGPNGEKILFVEEIQSDWHQAGRKRGYRDEQLSEQQTLDLLDESGYEAKYNGTNWVVTSKDGSLVPNKLGGGEAKNQFAGNLSQVAGMVLGRQDLMPFRQERQVPDAPFKGNAWAELSMKRLIRMAAEGGYDQLAWTTGEQQAERYDLSDKIDSIEVTKREVEGYGIGRTVDLQIPDGGVINIDINEMEIKLKKDFGEAQQKITDFLNS